jgi:hypothetical protein
MKYQNFTTDMVDLICFFKFIIKNLIFFMHVHFLQAHLFTRRRRQKNACKDVKKINYAWGQNTTPPLTSKKLKQQVTTVTTNDYLLSLNEVIYYQTNYHLSNFVGHVLEPLTNERARAQCSRLL